jgi:hypothetical protein
MLDRWNLTVCSVTQSILASCAFEYPFETSSRISASRRVRPDCRPGSLLGRGPVATKMELWNTWRTADTTSPGSAALETKTAAPDDSASSTDEGSSYPETTTAFISG